MNKPVKQSKAKPSVNCKVKGCTAVKPSDIGKFKTVTRKEHEKYRIPVYPYLIP